MARYSSLLQSCSTSPAISKDFGQTLFQIVAIGLLLLNWRLLIAPQHLLKHFKRYKLLYRYIAISALLPAAFLAGLPAPLLFVGMVLYAFYLVKAVPWIKETRELSAKRWTTLVFVVALGVTVIVAGIQALSYVGMSHVLTSRFHDEGNPEQALSAVQLALAYGFRLVKYWLMLSILASGALLTKMNLTAKKINAGREEIAREALIASGLPQNDANVAAFLEGDVKTNEGSKAACAQQGVDPAFLPLAGKGAVLFEAAASLVVIPALPFALSVFPCIAMSIPSASNAKEYQKPKPTAGQVVHGFALRNLDGTLE